MQCSCGNETKVKDSRREPNFVWRKRFCDKCGNEFTTIERMCETMPNKRSKVIGMKVKTVNTPIIKRPLRERTIPKSDTAIQEKSSRNKIEDLKMQREINKQDSWG